MTAHLPFALASLLAAFAGHPDLATLAVNVSGRSFDEPGLPHYIQHHLAHFGVDMAQGYHLHRLSAKLPPL